jgi:hypothetical protein
MMMVDHTKEIHVLNVPRKNYYFKDASRDELRSQNS